ncbi:acetyl-CoA C-acyltransferase [Bradyrhizobium sp. 186]|uniref:acetyl-CoA C-acyltransferase n=1 Tax=Bradyrhizobium sp. 186 TaxID=2782654 RepID=UPI002000E4E6|nr:acetyl-CoA C-acyltransferase [Bradyrhizobium sp. 186]UPK34478.1 acetyl-CoA C-acyltransferase [Bradyrhizobium sp. 186]
MFHDVYIAGASRTPMGSLLGTLSPLTAIELGAHATRATLARATIQPHQIDQVFVGCVLPAGLGQAPARQVAASAGITKSAQATTVNKMCGSGMQAVILAHDAIRAESANVVLAGGMESMSNAPFLLPRQRRGIKFGHGEIVDHVARDGLEDAYEKHLLMGVFADRSAIRHQISRQELDDFARMSLERAKKASEKRLVDDEIAAVDVPARNGHVRIERDEQPLTADVARIPQLMPAFGPEGRMTAASSSSISDGAATMAVMSSRSAEAIGPGQKAQIIGHTCYAAEPEHVCSAPGLAIAKLLQKVGWSAQTADLYEVNEAFAVVPILAAKHVGIGLSNVNIRGGACALGHPIGASGARILTTLLACLQARGGGRGIASICLGGGEALAVAIEVR